MLNMALFVFLYCMGFILAIFHNPVFSFVLYELVYFMNPRQRWWYYMFPDISYPYTTVVLMAFALFVIYRKHLLTNRLFAAPQFKWIYAFLIVYGVTWFIAVKPDLHQEASINFLKLVIIISMAYKLVDTRRKLDFAVWGYLFGCWYVSFIIYQTGRNANNRVEGIGTVDASDANGIAAALAPSVVLSLYYFWMTKSKKAKLLFAIVGVFVANAIVLINSRGSFLAVAVSVSSFMFYMYFSSVKIKYQKAIAIGLTVAGLAGVIYLADSNFLDRVKTMKNVEVTREQQSATTRFIFWASAWEMAKDYPFGAGSKTFETFGTNYIPLDVDTGFSRNRAVHSSWFEALAEAGYLGLLLFFLIIYTSFKSLRKCMAKLKAEGDFEHYFKVVALQGALLSFLVSLTFMNRLRAEVLYWLILYSACAYNIYIVKASGKEQKQTMKAVENPRDADLSTANARHMD